MFNAKRITFWTKVILFLLIALIFCSASAYAAGEGDGGGGGGGPSVPLYMDWSYPSDGETGVSVTPIIQCKFSHNVAQYDVRKRNATLFTLTKTDGTVIPIKVYMADAQLEFEKRQYIYLTPVRPLENNTTYIVSVKDGIQAKNGMATEKPQSFRFTTGRITVTLAGEAADSTTGEDTAAVAIPVDMTALQTEPGDKTSSAEKTSGSAKASKTAGDTKTGAAVSENGATKTPRQTKQKTESGTTKSAETASAGEQAEQKNTAGIKNGIIWIVILVLAALSFLLTAIRMYKNNVQPADGEHAGKKEA